MIRKTARIGPAIGFAPFLARKDNPHDQIIVDKHGIYDPNPTETGWQRLRNLFKPYEGQVVHPEVTGIVQTFATSFLLGGIYGGCTNSRGTFIHFIENNEATQFRNHYEAKRQLSDKMFTSFMRGLIKWGTKVSIFCTTLVTTYTIVTVYRNKDSAWHYSVAGAASGAVYKFQLGPKAMVSGAFFGLMFGSIYASLKTILLFTTNLSEGELREIKQQLKTERTSEIEQAKKTLFKGGEETQIDDLMKSVGQQ